jgi:hypothetical protein
VPRRRDHGVGVVVGLASKASTKSCVQFVVVLVASVGFLAQAPKLPWATAAVVVAWLAWSFGSVGAVLDRSRFAVASELVRHVVAVAALLMLVR